MRARGGAWPLARGHGGTRQARRGAAAPLGEQAWGCSGASTQRCLALGAGPRLHYASAARGHGYARPSVWAATALGEQHGAAAVAPAKASGGVRQRV